MNFNHLYYFYVTVREGSVTAAAKALSVSQPALSSQIKSFETFLENPLFERRARKMFLTSYGKAVYSRAAEIFEIASTIPIGTKKLTEKGLKVRIGVSDEVERPFAVKVVSNLFENKKSRPPAISFTAGVNDDLIAKLRNFELDAVITNRPSSSEDLEIGAAFVMPVVFATSTGKKKSHRNVFSCHSREINKIIKKLGRGFSVPTSRLKLRQEIESFLGESFERGFINFESDTIAAIVRAIIDDVGVGFVPLPYVIRSVQRKEIRIYGTKEGLWKHTLFVLIKKGRAQSPGLQDVLEAFEKIKAEFIRTIGAWQLFR